MGVALHLLHGWVVFKCLVICFPRASLLFSVLSPPHISARTTFNDEEVVSTFDDWERVNLPKDPIPPLHPRYATSWKGECMYSHGTFNKDRFAA